MLAAVTVRHRLRGLSSRTRAIGMFFATSLAARGLGIACQLLQVPIVMRALGAEAFGLWMTLTGIGTMIAFADFGVGQGAQNKLAEAFAAHDLRRARALWDSALVFFLALGALLAAAVTLVVSGLDFSRLFDLASPAVQQQAPAAVAVTLGLFCVNFPFGLAQRLANSRQKGWTHNLALAAASVAGLGCTIVVTRFHAPLPLVIAAAQGPLVIANAALLAWQLSALGWTDGFAGRCRWAVMRELFGLGAHFGVQQLLLTLLLSLPQVIISTSLGAAAVTPYALAQRLFNLFSVIQNAFMLPIWPAYSDAKAKADFAWMRRTLRVSLGATLGCTLLPMALGALFARALLLLWVGPAAELPSPALIWLMFAWNTLVFLAQPFGFLLAGLSEVTRLTHYAVVSAALSAALMCLLVRRHGAEGVVAGIVIGILPFVIRGNIIEALHVLRRFPRDSGPEASVVARRPLADAR